jgi:hypothetical protein
MCRPTWNRLQHERLELVDPAQEIQLAAGKTCQRKIRDSKMNIYAHNFFTISFLGFVCWKISKLKPKSIHEAKPHLKNDQMAELLSTSLFAQLIINSCYSRFINSLIKEVTRLKQKD